MGVNYTGEDRRKNKQENIDVIAEAIVNAVVDKIQQRECPHGITSDDVKDFKAFMIWYKETKAALFKSAAGFFFKAIVLAVVVGGAISMYFGKKMGP